MRLLIKMIRKNKEKIEVKKNVFEFSSFSCANKDVENEQNETMLVAPSV